MGNQVQITPTTFKSNNSETYGYRIYDDYRKAYENCWESDRYASANTSPELFLREVIYDYVSNSGPDELAELIDYTTELKNGLSVDGQWFDAEEITSIIETIEDAYNQGTL